MHRLDAFPPITYEGDCHCPRFTFRRRCLSQVTSTRSGWGRTPAESHNSNGRLSIILKLRFCDIRFVCPSNTRCPIIQNGNLTTRKQEHSPWWGAKECYFSCEKNATSSRKRSSNTVQKTSTAPVATSSLISQLRTSQAPSHGLPRHWVNNCSSLGTYAPAHFQISFYAASQIVRQSASAAQWQRSPIYILN